MTNAGRGGSGRRRGGSPAPRPVSRTTAEVLDRFSDGPRSGIFTDGSCSGNPGPGGWGVVFVRDGEIVDERWGDDPATTNNRMELMALIEGFRMLEAAEVVDIYSDSRLVVDTITKWAAGWERRGWRRPTGEVANLDLVREAFELSKQRPLARLQWIRAHDGSLWNEYADALATAYMRPEV